jgi:hypothetical protein
VPARPAWVLTRLIEEFHTRLRDVPHTWVEWNCSQLLQNTPLHPVTEWGRQRFGSADVPSELRIADLENSLTQVKLDPGENTALLAPLLGIPLPREVCQLCRLKNCVADGNRRGRRQAHVRLAAEATRAHGARDFHGSQGSCGAQCARLRRSPASYR